MIRVLWLVILVAVPLPSRGIRVATENPLKPITVCEILRDHKLYNGNVVAVIGRFSGTEEGSWLGDDNCELKLQTDRLTWPNLLWLEYDPSLPPLSGNLHLNMDDVRTRLAELKQRPQSRPAKAGWVIVFGRLEFPQELQTVVVAGRRRVAGYGHMGTSPSQLVVRQGDIKYLSNE